MVRSVVVGALVLTIGVAGARFVFSRPAAVEPGVHEECVAPSQPGSAGPVGAVRTDGDRYQVDLEQRLKLLEAKLAEEAAERRTLQQRFDAVTAQLEARGAGVDAAETARTDSSAAPATAESPANDAEPAPAADDSKSAMERALAAAGLEPAAAAEIKRRHDALAMAEMYLRDQATREQWQDSPRFSEEMAALNAQQTSIRDEIGDDAYDRYLFALGETNRVRVDDVLSQSPAAQAGLQAGDMIVRYGEDRIFAPADLVEQTRTGTAGEAVRLEIIRNGERLEVDVPRGPLGLRIAATQAMPQTS